MYLLVILQRFFNEAFKIVIIKYNMCAVIYFTIAHSKRSAIIM